MKNIIFLFISLSISTIGKSQSATELNDRSKQLIREGNYQEALPLLRKAAALNVAEAQYNLGYLLAGGALGRKDLGEAVVWYRKASENQFNDGHYAMMMAYGTGAGVAYNADSAFLYAAKCAANDHPTCMWNVVNCYLTGNGVKADTAQFKAWVIRLAKLPNPENLTQSAYITSARLQLAKLHKDGEYFSKDMYKAYMWYLIYNESKADFSISEQNSTITEITGIEKKLSAEQRRAAVEDAEKLLGRKLLRVGELHKNSL